MEKQYNNAVFARAAKEEEFKLATKKFSESEIRMQILQKESLVWNSRLSRDKEHRESLASKIESLELKMNEITDEIEKMKNIQQNLDAAQLISKGNILTPISSNGENQTNDNN